MNNKSDAGIPFKGLYEKYASLVYNLCLNYLQNEEDAKDATQEIFVKIYQKKSKFKGKSSLKTWIYRIAINHCLDFIKAKSRSKRFGFMTSLFNNHKDETIAATNLTEFNHPGILLEDKEALQQLFNHINSLADKQKTAIILKFINGLSQKQIANIMQVSEKAVESLLMRAKKNIRKKIK